MMASTSGTLFKGNFVLVFFSSMLLFMAFYLLMPTLPVYLTQELRIHEGKTGLVLSIYTLAALVIRPFTGYLIDRYGRKAFYVPTFFLFALIFMGYPLAGTLGFMLLVRFAHGLAWGVATTTGSTLIVDIIPAQRRGEGLGLYGLAMTVPMALGPFVGLQITKGHNYSSLFIFAAILAFAGFVLTLFVKYPKVPQTHNNGFIWRNLIEKSSLPVTFNLLLLNISYGGLVSFISLYAIATGIGYTGVFFIVFASGIALARIYGGRIFDRRGPKAISVTGILFLIFAYISLSLVTNIFGFLAAAVFAGLGSGVIFPTFQAMVNNMVSPLRRGAANSTMFTGLDLGIGIGMLITGLSAHKIGLPHTYLIFVFLNSIALLFFLQVTLKHYRKHKT